MVAHGVLASPWIQNGWCHWKCIHWKGLFYGGEVAISSENLVRRGGLTKSERGKKALRALTSDQLRLDQHHKESSPTLSSRRWPRKSRFVVVVVVVNVSISPQRIVSTIYRYANIVWFSKYRWNIVIAFFLPYHTIFLGHFYLFSLIKNSIFGNKHL